MGTITIKNLSTYTDYAALARVSRFMAGDEYYAIHDEHGKKVVKITKCGNTYTVTDCCAVDGLTPVE